ncbi:MAG: AAA family ATPase [Roseinatronobacter sp.]
MSEKRQSDTISKLEVYNLFGRFDHVINLDDDESISIITAPNGYGKTVLLRILDSIFNRRLNFFWKITFREIRVTLASGRRLEIFQDLGNLLDDDNGRLRKSVSVKTYGFGADNELHRVSPKFEISELRYFERHFPVDQIGPDKWLDFPTDEVLTTNEIIERYADQLPDRLRVNFKLPSWLQEAVSSIEVHLVETQRLLSLEDQLDTRVPPSRRRSIPPSVVEKDAKDLADRISRLLQEYANESQKLDQTFPKRIIEQTGDVVLSEDEIRADLQSLAERRDRLVSVGLLGKTLNEPIQPSDVFKEDSIRKILAIYIEDTRKKLGIFDETYERIRLFKEILDEHFSFKSVKIDPDKGISSIDNDSGDVIPLSELSSGEQHELVLIYDLLFKVEPGSTILIDEPELSLHVGWQKRFISDLQKVKELNSMNVVIATHSPQIIHDRWDLVQELASN